MEPLKTDEKLHVAAARERDMDTHMILGCSGFVAASFLTYFLIIWPFLVWMHVETVATLLLTVAISVAPAYSLGFVACRRFEIAGAAGFVGGVLAGGIFLHLRFRQVFLEAAARRIPEPEYPDWVQWFVPLLVILGSLFLATATLTLWQNKSQ